MLVLLVAMFLPRGDYVMQGVHKQNVPDSILRSPSLTGAHLRDSWLYLEPQPGVYDFRYLDEQFMRLTSLGKRATLGMYAGKNSPAWQTQAGFQNMVSRLGARYSGSEILDAVHMTSTVTDDSMEMYLPSGVNLTSGQIYSSWTSAINAYNKAFPSTVLVLDLAILPNNLTQRIDEYARNLLGVRFEAIVCNLKASTNPQAKHILELERLRNEGVRIGFEMVGPSSDQDRFGGTFAQAKKLGNQLGGSWYQIYQGDVPRSTYLSKTPEASGWVLLALALGIIILYHRGRS
jgi:hypothetical protein